MGGEESKEEEPPAPPEPEPQRQSRRSARQSSGKQEDRPSAQERLSQAYQTKHSRLQSAKESVIERQSQKAAQAEKARATAENNFRGSRRRPKRPSEDVDYEQQEPGSYNASTPSSRGPGSSARGVGSAMGSARQQMGSGMGSARQMGSQMGSGSVRGMGSGMGSGMNNNLGSGSSPAGAAGASVRLSNSPNSSSKQVRASSGPGSSAEKVRLSGERQRLSSEKPPFLAGQGAAPRLSSGGGFASGETKKINSGAMMGSLQPQSLTELQSAEAKRVSFVEAVRASTKDELRLGSGMGSGTMDQAAVEERLPSSLHELPQQAPPNVMHLAADSQEQQVRMGTQDPNITSFAPTSAAMHAPPMQSFAMGGPPSMASSVPSMMQQMQSFQLGSTAQVGGGSGDFVMSNMGSSGGSGGGVASGGGVGSGGGVPLMVNHRGDVYDGGNNKKLTITKDRRGGNVDPRELNSDMPAAAPGSGFGDPMQSTGSGGNEPVAPGELPTLDIEDGDQDERTLITEKPPVIVMVRTWRPEGAHLYEAQPTWIYDEPSGKWVAELRHRIVPDSGNYDDPYAELGTRRARRIIESPYAYGGRGTSPGRVDTAYMHHLYKREPYQKHHTMIADDKEHNNYYSYHDDADDDIHWRTDLDFREALSGRAGDDPLAMVPGLQLGGLSGFNFNAMDRTTSVGSTPNDGRRATSAVDKESLLKQYMKTYYDDDRVSESPSTMTEARRQQRKARRQARKERIAQDGGRSRSYGRMDPNLRSVDYSQRKSAYKYNTETQKLKRMHQHDSRRHQHGMLSFAPA